MIEGKLNIIPQNERLLVESIEVENVTKSGLVLTASEGKTLRTSFAEVIAVHKSLTDDYDIGDIVYHNPNAGADITLYGKKYILLTVGEVLAKVEVAGDEDVDLDEAIRDNQI